MIELENITVALPPKHPHPETILEDITLSIQPGDWIVVVGANGSGKTTLLKTIAGLVPVASGSLRYPGDRPPIALLLQEPDNQFVASSVRNELLLSPPPGLPAEVRHEKVTEAVEQFSLTSFLDRNPHRLSGGEKQRVALATVWLAQPRVLLLDEPTSYLDAVERERCIRFVRRLNAEGVAVVWATPGGTDLRQAARVAYLDEGKLLYQGTPEEFKAAARERGFLYLPTAGESPSAKAPVTAATTRDERAQNLGDTIVSLDHVSFAYDDRAVLDNLSCAVRAGECVGISGRNGSGKSTLLGLLSGVYEPSGGKITRSFSKPVERGEQQVFYLFQNPERLFFAETVFEEVAFGLRSLGTPKDDILHRVAGALSHVGLEPREFLDRVPFSLSFGEMRRLAFAIALVLRPRFLLLDEPASCLDASGRALLSHLVAHFKSERCAVVIASHDALELGDSIDRWIEL